MNTEQKIVIGAAVTLVAVAALYEYVQGPKKIGAEITPESLKIGMNLPIMWLFYNDSEVNSRQWYDFGGRSSNVINIPLLNMCYNTIKTANGKDYRIEVIGGLQGVAERLGGWEALPTTMRNPKASVTEPEEDWIRTAILAKYGGLWVSPSVIFINPMGKLPTEQIIAFGQHDAPMYGTKYTSPGFRAIWSPKANEPLFIEWEKRCRGRLEGQLGGRQVRGDSHSDWQELSTLYSTNVLVSVKEELGRDPRTSKKLDLEDLLAAGTEGRIPFSIPGTSKYIPIPYKDLLDRRTFGWVLRMSEEQIMESDIVIQYLFKLSEQNSYSKT
jgi:hypothetical protein